jgi:2-aminoethylphosphonate-pyruvate transaminase
LNWPQGLLSVPPRPMFDEMWTMNVPNKTVFKFNGPMGQEDMSYLLLPGPVTTSQNVKLAALADRDPLDPEFVQMVRDIRNRLLSLAGAGQSRDCVLVQGPAGNAIETALGSFAPVKSAKTLIISNGADGDNAANVLQRLGRPYIKIDKPEHLQPSGHEIEPVLQADRSITHVWMCHCDSSSGILNPVTEIAAMAKRLNRTTMIDASNSFGAMPVNMLNDGIDVLVSTASMCLQSLPGLSFVIAGKDLLSASIGHSHSIAMDLFEDWRSLESTGQFRSTPPTQILAALSNALRELDEEGGQEARFIRYQKNAVMLRDGMRSLDFVPLLDDAITCPVVLTFLAPGDSAYQFESFRAALRTRGFSIAPGKLARLPGFRLCPIGDVAGENIETFLQAMADVLKELDISDTRPDLN